MMTLTLPTAASPIRWETIRTSDGDFKIALTPPTFDQWLSARIQDDPEKLVRTRLQCVTGWRDVLTVCENGGKAEVPFTADNFQTLLMSDPAILTQVHDLCVKLFRGRSETESKNSDPPPSAAIPEIPELRCTTA